MDNVIDKTSYAASRSRKPRTKPQGTGCNGPSQRWRDDGTAIRNESSSTSREVLACLVTSATASAMLAAEKGAFPMFKRDLYLQSEHIKTC